MSIKSGQHYKITNERTKLVVGLSSSNHKSILGYPFHGGENQQWITEKQVNGQWTIRSVEHQKYLGVETIPDNGTHLIGLVKDQFWDIEILPDCEDLTKPRVKLCQWVRSTCFAADFPLRLAEYPAIGADLQLWMAGNGKDQVWVLEEYSSRFPLRRISIKSDQRYKITNEKTRLVVDLSGGDHKSILGYTFHGGENQQWITEKQVNGQWTIRSVEHQKYLGVETIPDNGTHLVGLIRPQFWDIEILPDCEDPIKPRVKLCQWVRGTCFAADFPLRP